MILSVSIRRMIVVKRSNDRREKKFKNLDYYLRLQRKTFEYLTLKKNDKRKKYISRSLYVKILYDARASFSVRHASPITYPQR